MLAKPFRDRQQKLGLSPWLQNGVSQEGSEIAYGTYSMACGKVNGDSLKTIEKLSIWTPVAKLSRVKT